MENNGFFEDEESLDEGLRKDLRKEKAKKWFQRILIVVLIVIIIILLLAKCGGKGITGNEGTGRFLNIFNSDAVVSGEKETRSREEIVAELNRQVEDGYISISMNTSPYFENGNAKGNLSIDNSKENRHPQVIQIFLLDENDKASDLIYTSPVIPVGSRVDEDSLDVPLSKGTYKCVAYFNAVTEEGEILGTAGAVINITVKN